MKTYFFRETGKAYLPWQGVSAAFHGLACPHLIPLFQPGFRPLP
jgi:hypothetical protein